MLFGQPGGGGSRWPEDTLSIACGMRQCDSHYTHNKLLRCCVQEGGTFVLRCWLYDHMTYNVRCTTINKHLGISDVMKWFVSQWPYLIEETAIAPDITGSGVLAIVKGLWSCPLDWNLTTMRDVVVFMLEVSGEPKISNLHIYNCA